MNHQDQMLQAERDAGGVIAVVPQERVPYNQLFLVGDRGELLAKVNVPVWKDTPAVAEMLVETIEFVSRRKRRHTKELWVNQFALEDLQLAMAYFCDPDAQEEPEEVFPE